MKKGGPSHPKVLGIANVLGIHRLHALGLLEQMFHWVYEYCPGGDIGKWSNQVIADGIHWDGDSDKLIDVLVDLGWIDRCANHRLVIHDWAEHAPNWIHSLVSRDELQFASLEPISPIEGLDPLNKLSSDYRVGDGKVGIGKEEIDAVFEHWNEFAPKNGLMRLVRITNKRRDAVRNRLKLKDFDFKDILEVIPKCPFLLGSTEWKITFDWIFKNDLNWVKVIEGNYLSNTNGSPISQGTNLTGVSAKYSKVPKVTQNIDESQGATA